MATLPTSWKSGAKSKKTTFGSGANRPQVPSARDNLDQLMGALNTPRATADANKPSSSDNNGTSTGTPDTKPPVQVTYGGVAGGYGSGDPVSSGVDPDKGPGQNDPPEPVDPKEEATAAGAFPAGGFTIGGRIPGTNKGVREFTITQDLFNLIPEAQRPAALAAFNGGTGSAMEYLSQNRMSPWGQQLSKAARFGRGGKDLVHKTPGNAWGNPTGWMQKRIDRNYEAQQGPQRYGGGQLMEDGTPQPYGGPGWDAPMQQPEAGGFSLPQTDPSLYPGFTPRVDKSGRISGYTGPDGGWYGLGPQGQPTQWSITNSQPTQSPYGTGQLGQQPTFFDPRILQGMYPGY